MSPWTEDRLDELLNNEKEAHKKDRYKKCPDCYCLGKCQSERINLCELGKLADGTIQ